jgi:hypothetical protein
MDQFVAWLKLHHPELAKRIIGSLVVDEHHLTEGQLLAKAREFYSNGARATGPCSKLAPSASHQPAAPSPT